VPTVQEYCQDLLTRAIEAEHARERVEEVEAKRGPLEGLTAIANDPDYLTEWTASIAPRRRPAPPAPADETPQPAPIRAMAPAEDSSSPAPPPEAADASEIVLKHAAMAGDDPSAFLATLRRGEPIVAATAQELLGALHELERAYRSIPRLERRLAYALHRLAFEGQVLLTDAWPAHPIDAGTVDVLRIVQEAVDRVLSGEDIRYFAPGSGPEVVP
jgi:hypothetical protein